MESEEEYQLKEISDYDEDEDQDEDEDEDMIEIIHKKKRKEHLS